MGIFFAVAGWFFAGLAVLIAALPPVLHAVEPASGRHAGDRSSILRPWRGILWLTGLAAICFALAHWEFCPHPLVKFGHVSSGSLMVIAVTGAVMWVWCGLTRSRTVVGKLRQARTEDGLTDTAAVRREFWPGPLMSVTLPFSVAASELALAMHGPAALALRIPVFACITVLTTGYVRTRRRRGSSWFSAAQPFIWWLALIACTLLIKPHGIPRLTVLLPLACVLTLAIAADVTIRVRRGPAAHTDTNPA